MSRNWIIIFVFCFPLLLAAQKVRGISSSGSLIPKKEVVFPAEKLVCTMTLSEEVKDGIWSNHENITLSVLVRNYHQNKRILPKLELRVLSESNCSPIMKIIPMELILPGQAGSYSAHLKWQDCFNNSVLFLVKAFDVQSQLSTDWTEIEIDVETTQSLGN